MDFSEVIEEFPDSILIKWFDGLERFFQENKIYLAYPWRIAGVYKPGELIRIRKNTIVERYSNHPQKRIIALGAFSYCQTPLISPDFTAGRYCSIAQGVSLSDQEHPRTE